MNLTIKKKLLFSNLANIVFIMAVGLIAYFAMRTLDRSMDAIQRNGETIKTQLQADQSHDALRADVLAAMLAGENNDTAEQQRVKQDANDHIAQFRKLVQSLESSVDDGPVRQAVARVKPDMDAYLAACSQIVPLALTDLPAARRAYPQFMTVFRTLEKSMEELSDLIEKNSASTKDQGDAALAAAHRNIVIVALAAAVVALAMGLLMSRSITAPLDQAITFASHIAAGDLSDRLTLHPGDRTETGRLKQALQNMNDSLNGIVARVRAGTDTIATASGEIASGNLDLSSRTEQQASALEQTASSMEELTATVKHNGDSARQADQLSRSASEVALRGGQVVANVVETMGAINQASNQIVDIIAVIEGIAFQTNILALNAAVEAARAGEQGRGFAVVATEVRNLAHRSAAAAKEIKTLIDTSVERVGQGSALVGQAGDTMQEIVVSVQRVTTMMGQITAAGQEQEAGIGQINQAIAQMDAVTQQNAALVEQAAAAAAAMQEQASQLTHVVSVFRLAS